MRNLQRPTGFLIGHTYGIRRVKYSPYDSNILASASYDMTICIWNVNFPAAPIFRHTHHTEFAVGVDFSLFNEK
jgi:peroxin-7